MKRVSGIYVFILLQFDVRARLDVWTKHFPLDLTH